MKPLGKEKTLVSVSRMKAYAKEAMLPPTSTGIPKANQR